MSRPVKRRCAKCGLISESFVCRKCWEEMLNKDRPTPKKAISIKELIKEHD